MRKIAYTLIGLAGLFLASCDMDKYPHDQIPTDKSLEKFSDFENFRNGLYLFTQYMYTGGYILQPEIQADGLTPAIDYSNVYGPWYRWQFTAEDGGQWSYYYQLLSNCNLMLEKGEALMPSFSEEEQTLMKSYLGEAHLMRALAVNELVLRFSKPYDAATAKTDLGVCLVTRYAPSSDASTYPLRSSVQETYDFIAQELKEAEAMIATEGKQNSGYLTADAVQALKARVALQKGLYAEAIEAAKTLVDKGAYPLADTKEQLEKMWKDDESTETIFQPVFKPGQMGAATGTILVDKTGSDTKVQPDFFPTQTVLDLFDKEKDLRFKVYFKQAELTYPSGTVSLYYCSKYPGNPKMGNNAKFVNAPKVFRIAEMYLILAESYQASGDETNALLYLNKLRESRGYTDPVSDSGERLSQVIRDERQRELYLEGFRLWDLKRYGEGMKGRKPQNGAFTHGNGESTSTDIAKGADDFHFQWPIPKHETDVNKQIKQNEGY